MFLLSRDISLAPTVVLDDDRTAASEISNSTRGQSLESIPSTYTNGSSSPLHNSESLSPFTFSGKSFYRDHSRCCICLGCASFLFLAREKGSSQRRSFLSSPVVLPIGGVSWVHPLSILVAFYGGAIWRHVLIKSGVEQQNLVVILFYWFIFSFCHYASFHFVE